MSRLMEASDVIKKITGIQEIYGCNIEISISGSALVDSDTVIHVTFVSYSTGDTLTEEELKQDQLTHGYDLQDVQDLFRVCIELPI